MVNFSRASLSPKAPACAIPFSVSGLSRCPWRTPLMFHCVCPWRTMMTRVRSIRFNSYGLRLVAPQTQPQQYARSLPLDGRRGLGRNIVNDAVDAAHFVADAIGD